MRIASTLALLAVLAGAGCARGPVAPEHVRVDDLSVVLVILDAAGARYLGAYGNPLPTSPNIDALGREGTLFERAYAQASWTLPSAASFLTGKYPPQRAQPGMRLEGETLATLLRDAGFHTAAFSESPLVTSDLGFSEGFAVFKEYFPKRLFDERPRTFGRVDSSSTIDNAIDWIRDQDQGRFFAYVHLLPPHCPYDPPTPFRGRFDPDYSGSIHGSTETLLKIEEGALRIDDRDLAHVLLEYQENLAFADHEVGRLLEALRARRLLDRTIVVLAADHGEAFREHGRMLHTTTLFEEMIRVPLIIRLPPRFGKLPRRWSGVVEMRDVLPTIADALGVAPAAASRRSLLSLLRRHADIGRVARAWTSDKGALLLAAVITDRYKLVMDRRAHTVGLYDLTLDPHELHDVSQANRALVTRLAKRLRRGGRDTLSFHNAEVDEGTARKLRALGYAQ